ncbi:MAG: FAD-dependent oxidoreductase, partial [Firmicutes bacterium HGW-Firmicutes-5]
KEGIQAFGKKIKDFDRKDAVLTGVETRTSSPIRILRDEAYMSSVKGLYPCGEGAGYAGGIMSAALDGMKVAESILNDKI